MSATMDADRIAAYWGQLTPRLHIPGHTYDIKDFVLEDVLAFTHYIPPKKRKKGKQYVNNTMPSTSTSKDADADDYDESNDLKEGKTRDEQTSEISISDLIKRVDETSIDYDLLAILIRYILKDREKQDDGSILCFLPGANEIFRAEQAIRRICCGNAYSFRILPLHGGLQPKDQKLCFDPVPLGETKIILSTVRLLFIFDSYLCAKLRFQVPFCTF